MSTVAPKTADSGADPVVRYAWVLLTWLIPGAGFFIKRRPVRGAVLFALITVTFAVGVHFRGCVEIPIWSPGSDGFNLVAILTFLVQLGAGLPSLVSLLAHKANLRILAGDPADPLFDLATFYILVAGALNYFVVCNFYDRFYGNRGSEAPKVEDKKSGDSELKGSE
ncbi:MAG: DUF6677 family protein [bacterium]